MSCVKKLFIFFSLHAAWIQIEAVQSVQQEGVQVAEGLQHFLEEFEAAQSSLLWIRDEFRAQARSGNNYGGMHERSRHKREENNLRKWAGRNSNHIAEVNGDTWYNDFRKKECSRADKSINDGLQQADNLPQNDARNLQEIKFDPQVAAPQTQPSHDKILKSKQIIAGAPGEAEVKHEFETIKVGINLDGRTTATPIILDNSAVQARFNARKFLAQDRSSVVDLQQKWDKQKKSLPARQSHSQPFFGLNSEINQENYSNVSSNFNYLVDNHVMDPLMKRSVSNAVNKHSQIHYSDQLSQQKNDLSHEANYKLSKKEQEGSSDPVVRTKRDVNPSHRIKLKISERMMKKGLGAQLPGDAYGEDFYSRRDFNEIKSNDNKISEPEPSQRLPIVPNYDLFKREIPEIKVSSSKSEPHLDENGKIINNGANDASTSTSNPPADYNDENAANFNYYDENYNNYESESHNEQCDDSKDFDEYTNKLIATTSDAQNLPKLNREIENVDVNDGKFIANSTSLVSASNDSETCSNLTTERATNATELPATTETIEGMKQLPFNHDGGKQKREAHRKRNSIDKDESSSRRKQSIGDLISGQLPNQILKAVHEMVDSHDSMKKYIQPYLAKPNYEILKDPSKLSDIKTKEMMNDLISSIDELVEDQIKMRTCLSLTPELQEFYEQLTGQNKPDEEVDEEDSDDYDQEQEPENSLQPKKRNTRNIQYSKDITEKYLLIHSLLDQLQIVTIEDKNLKYSLQKYLQAHLQLLDSIKFYRRNGHLQRSSGFPFVNKEHYTEDFSKLINLQHFMLEENVGSI